MGMDLKEFFELFTVTPLVADQWPRLRALRLAALQDTDAIHGDLVAEQNYTESNWRELFGVQQWAALVHDGSDVGMLVVSKPPLDRYGDCWIKSWWIAPDFRGAGGSKTLLNWLDRHCVTQQWRIQALGVFETNTDAIAAYKKLGFKSVGIRKPSSRANQFFIIMARELNFD